MRPFIGLGLAAVDLGDPWILGEDTVRGGLESVSKISGINVGGGSLLRRR